MTRRRRRAGAAPIETPTWTDHSLRIAMAATGTEADETFDAVYPRAIREQSDRYWTPLDVARRAAEMLAPHVGMRVLDVGSGPGKFCIVGALTTHAEFVGVEHRRPLFDAACDAASRCHAVRATFVHGPIESVDWRQFDAFYFYNPFEESPHLDHYDLSVDLSAVRRARDLEFVRTSLDAAAPGTRVVTYHGLGSAMPASFECVRTEPAGSDGLELWIRGPG